MGTKRIIRKVINMGGFYKHGRSVAEFTKRWREDHGMTQGDLGEELGVHPQYVSNIERGIHKGAVGFVKTFAPMLTKEQAKHLYELVCDERMEKIMDAAKR